MSRVNLEELAKRNIIVFLDYYGITTETGEELDFYNHPYLVDIFLDFSPKQVWLKAAQLGLSTTAIIKTFFIVAKMGLDVIYSMPSATDLDDFVGGKINRIINMNERLKGLINGADNVKRKQIQDGVIYYRGTMTERAAISVSADLYVCDEMDRSDLRVVEQYKSRLNHSKHA
jgi:phage terminase large subunit GpA-like protein